ncbi:AfsR/SARP family transcriptional regulator [Arthrobacter agilis]|uniref:AfsR/SARP family transcriptional regulator n=1 Tax=Arthrobacter agilis TaxID=37921 RepID=UPI002782FB8C|nr:BTAD domain-containing putative transcriptional regulator [Arthrobacter agilis]MDQ0733750.1 DNA-binding SARP family transcriptional activator [Arthrobacter agilis]
MAGIVIQLLGPPSITHPDGEGHQPRGRKSWGLLTHLLLHTTPPARSQLAALLFAGADDPLGALRWHLADLRRVLGPEAVLGGNPVTLRLPPGFRLDTDLGAASLGEIRAELLDGLDFTDHPPFDAWLTMERHRLRHAVETLVYEGGLAALADGDTATAIRLSARAVELDPLNADFHALLVRSLVAAGDRAAARTAAAHCGDVFEDQLGTGLPAEVQHALAAPDTSTAGLPATRTAVASYLEAAQACLSAGAIATALNHLRVAGGLAERLGDRTLQAEALLDLAGALIHGAGGRGAEVADLLHRVLSLTRDGPAALQSAAYRELGFLAVQRGFPDSGARWLARATAAADGLPDERARALGVTGMLATDTADYPGAVVALEESVRLSAGLGRTRQEAFARAMLGRVHLLTGHRERAAVELDIVLALVAGEHWTAFTPFVEALRSEMQLATGDDTGAEDMADHAMALAASFGDRCYLDAAAHAKAEVLLARGDTGAASTWIRRGVQPNPWYRWFRGRNLDLASTAALTSHPHQALEFARELGERSSRYGHRELAVRAYSARAALGDEAVLPAMTLLASSIENPLLSQDLAARHHL